MPAALDHSHRDYQSREVETVSYVDGPIPWPAPPVSCPGLHPSCSALSLKHHDVLLELCCLVQELVEESDQHTLVLLSPTLNLQKFLSAVILNNDMLRLMYCNDSMPLHLDAICFFCSIHATYMFPQFWNLGFSWLLKRIHRHCNHCNGGTALDWVEKDVGINIITNLSRERWWNRQ